MIYLFSLGVCTFLVFALLACGLLLCRYDQRHGRETELSVGSDRRMLRYRSRPHEPATPAHRAGPGNVHQLSTRPRAPAEEHDTLATRHASPSAPDTRRAA
jgi:hypothetical protein